MFRGFGRHANGHETGTTSLSDAAARILETARREDWPLVYVADLEGRKPENWFAASILENCVVTGREARDGRVHNLAKPLSAGYALSDDLSFASVEGDGENRISDLSISKSELRRYVDWARSVQ